jgi:hypothetical protein
MAGGQALPHAEIKHAVAGLGRRVVDGVRECRLAVALGQNGNGRRLTAGPVLIAELRDDDAPKRNKKPKPQKRYDSGLPGFPELWNNKALRSR